MFDLDVRSSLQPGASHGASAVLHVLGLVALALLVSQSPPPSVPAARVAAPLWLILPDPAAPPPPRVAALHVPAPATPALLFAPPAPRRAGTRVITAPPQPAVRLETPANPLPPPPASTALPAPRIQADLFAGLPPSTVTTPHPALPVVPTAGFSSASAASPAGSRSGRVVSGAFTSIPAASPGPPRPPAAVRSGSFGDAVAAAPPKPRPPPESTGPSTPVEILAKPRPAYTDEARRRQIEGEVVLHVTFTASGRVDILSVIHGLGFGLDERATEAARRIRFRPALENGRPVDSTAYLHMTFQLAY